MEYCKSTAAAAAATTTTTVPTAPPKHRPARRSFGSRHRPSSTWNCRRTTVVLTPRLVRLSLFLSGSCVSTDFTTSWWMILFILFFVFIFRVGFLKIKALVERKAELVHEIKAPACRLLSVEAASICARTADIKWSVEKQPFSLRATALSSGT